MKTVVACFATVASLLAAPLTPEGIEPIDGEHAKNIAKKLVEAAGKIEKPQIKIEADTEQANGVHVPGKAGILVVPQKELKEGEELAAKFKTERGASLAYLFMYRIVPVIGDKTVDASKLRAVKLSDDQGMERTVYVGLLAVKQMSEDDYRLHLYGHDDTPLLDARFSEDAGTGTQTVTAIIRDVDDVKHQGKLAVTVFGKYRAMFDCGYRED